MHLRFGFLIIGFLAISLCSAQTLYDRAAPLGTIFTPQFSSAPFPHPARSSGHTYGNKKYPSEKHYMDSTVAIFVPEGFTPTDSVDIVIYFHGWYNNIDSACAQFYLLEQFYESSINALFVFPEGPKDAPDSFGGRIEEKNGLNNLVGDVLNYLQEKNVISTRTAGRIILSGHSGAFRAIAFCLMRGGMTENISDVILFDALYGQTEKFSHWIEHSNGRFINIYTNDGGTKNESENLMADLEGWGIPFFSEKETAVTKEDLRKNRCLFIHSDLSHNGVIAGRRQFRDYLMTSKLRQMR